MCWPLNAVSKLRKFPESSRSHRLTQQWPFFTIRCARSMPAHRSKMSSVGLSDEFVQHCQPLIRMLPIGLKNQRSRFPFVMTQYLGSILRTSRVTLVSIRKKLSMFTAALSIASIALDLPGDFLFLAVCRANSLRRDWMLRASRFLLARSRSAESKLEFTQSNRLAAGT